MEVVGNLFSTACYISGSWPSVRYLAYKYLTESKQALLANSNLGSDNVHRGAVLGTIFGLANATGIDKFFEQRVDRKRIKFKIPGLLEQPVT